MTFVQIIEGATEVRRPGTYPEQHSASGRHGALPR